MMNAVLIDNWNLFNNSTVNNNKGQILITSKYLLHDYMIYQDFNIGCYVLYIDDKESKRNIHLSNLMYLVDKRGL